ncbi:MAG: DUF975 family protein [Prevotellaceae bacterium]|jgi:uncharacterized membrane protein|nr:DUF975 family protein [Prevotellaceae bacterium]
MITENKDLMTQARENLKGNWGLPIGVSLVCAIIVGGFGLIVPPFGSLAVLLVAGPLYLGLYDFYLAFSRGHNVRFSQLFDGFSYFVTALLTYLLMVLIILLGLLLLIVPGIIWSFAYSQTFFVLADNPTISPTDALRKSREMMNGYKWKYFCLSCRFIGWALLCILTLGIGFIFLAPYMQLSFTKFYEDVKANYVEVA